MKEFLCWYCWQILPIDQLAKEQICLNSDPNCDGVLCNGICIECDKDE